jgi:hypothetical protein
MKALIEKSTGKTLGLWPNNQDVEVELFDERLHEWDENAPDDVVVEEVELYTKSGAEYVKGEKVDEKALLKAEILAEVSVSVDAKISEKIAGTKK